MDPLKNTSTNIGGDLRGIWQTAEPQDGKGLC